MEIRLARISGRRGKGERVSLRRGLDNRTAAATDDRLFSQFMGVWVRTKRPPNEYREIERRDAYAWREVIE